MFTFTSFRFVTFFSSPTFNILLNIGIVTTTFKLFTPSTASQPVNIAGTFVVCFFRGPTLTHKHSNNQLYTTPLPPESVLSQLVTYLTLIDTLHDTDWKGHECEGATTTKKVLATNGMMAVCVFFFLCDNTCPKYTFGRSTYWIAINSTIPRTCTSVRHNIGLVFPEYQPAPAALKCRNIWQYIDVYPSVDNTNWFDLTISFISLAVLLLLLLLLLVLLVSCLFQNLIFLHII